MFANAVKAAQSTHEEFMQAKLTYQQQYGMKQFLVLLKKHGLHAGRGNRLLIVHELLNVLHNDATRERLTQDDAKDEVPQVLLKTKQEQVSKRKRTEPWLAEIVKQISFPLHKRLCKYLPKEIVAQTIATYYSTSTTTPEAKNHNRAHRAHPQVLKCSPRNPCRPTTH